jgi:hypothetical protein
MIQCLENMCLELSLDIYCLLTEYIVKWLDSVWDFTSQKSASLRSGRVCSLCCLCNNFDFGTLFWLSRNDLACKNLAFQIFMLCVEVRKEWTRGGGWARSGVGRRAVPGKATVNSMWNDWKLLPDFDVSIVI